MIKVVAVDDNKSQLDLIVSTLNNDENIKCIGVDKPDNAIECIKRFKPDAVILDVVMPGTDGIELKKQIENDETIKETLIIFLTADELSKHKAEKVGYYKFMIKPFKPSSLVKAVTKAKIFNSLKAVRQELKLIPKH